MNVFHGILFDFDGVLARTMEDNFRAWQQVFADMGKHITPDEFYPLEGMRLREVALKLGTVFGVSHINPDEIIHNKEAYYLRNHAFSLYPGVEDLVERLWQAKVPMGIVTAGGIERIQKTLSSDFFGKFTTIITNENGGRGKPHPDPYLAGAKEIAVLPHECVVVENAPLGIESAKSAGMYCIAIASTVAKNGLSGANVIIDRFSELKDTFPICAFLSDKYTV